MVIKILNNHSFSDLNNIFSANYPFLKLVFYKNPHKNHEGSLPDNQIEEHELIKDFSLSFVSNEIEISDSMTVAELEEKFKSYFGLNVQVFRKSGNIWLQTTTTDDWSLVKQNEQGEIMSIPNDNEGDVIA